MLFGVDPRVVELRKWIRDPRMRHLAVSLVATCPDRDEGCELARVFWFVKQNVAVWRNVGVTSPAIMTAVLLSELGFQVGFSRSGNAVTKLPKRAPKHAMAVDPHQEKVGDGDASTTEFPVALA